MAIEMEIIILGEIVLRYNVVCVPVLADVVHKIVILIAEKEPVLPVLLVLIQDL